MHRASLLTQEIDLGASRFSITVSGGESAAATGVSGSFEAVTIFRWHQQQASAVKPAAAGPTTISVVGLERLAEGQPWRLYLRLESGGELEISCSRIIWGKNETTGIGRAYKT